MQKRLLGLLSIFFILTATAAGLVLIRQTQDLTPKASVTCSSAVNGKCGPLGGCPYTEQCKCVSNCVCQFAQFCQGDCIERDKDKCGNWCESNYRCKDVDGILKCQKDLTCTGGTCIEECEKCNNVGDKCCDSLECTQVSGDPNFYCKPKNNPNLKCDGGGGIPPPPPPPPPPPKDTPTPAPSCNGTNDNPAKLSPNGDGTLKIFGTIFRGTSINYQFAIKLNSTTCSKTNADKVIEAQLTEGQVTEIDTELSVTSSDKVCLHLTYKVGNEERVARGWILPDASNMCTKNKSSPKNLTPVIEAAGSPFVSQCWEIDENECKFNSMGLAFSVGESGTNPPPSPDPNVTGLRVRFQGITQKRADQKISVSFDTTWSETDLNITNDETGVYTIPVSGVPAGTYNVRVKGHSHLQKLFTNLVYNGVGYDLSTSEDQQMRAGDVTDDNAITIEDIAMVSSFYTDFSVSVDTTNSKMVASDINKDSIITIQDLALIAINWNDIRIEGDQ